MKTAWATRPVGVELGLVEMDGVTMITTYRIECEPPPVTCVLQESFACKRFPEEQKTQS